MPLTFATPDGKPIYFDPSIWDQLMPHFHYGPSVYARGYEPKISDEHDQEDSDMDEGIDTIIEILLRGEAVWLALNNSKEPRKIVATDRGGSWLIH